MNKTCIIGIALCAMLFALSLPAQAQQPTKIPRIGYLEGGSLSAAAAARIEAFRQGLRELSYVEGKNIVIEWRFAEGKPRSPRSSCGRACGSQGRCHCHGWFDARPVPPRKQLHDSHCDGAG